MYIVHPKKSFACIAIICLMVACNEDPEMPDLSAEVDEELSGGMNFTSYDLSINAFGEQGNDLTSAEEGQFVTGNSFFRNNWVTAPSSVKSLDGLGPLVNAISCGSCHFKDGRAAPPDFETDVLNGLLFRLSVPGTDENGSSLEDPNYGGQFQDKAILGVKEEGSIRISYEEIPGQYKDGSSYSLRKPTYEFYDLNYGNLAAGVMISPRIAQQIPGLGLLENVAEEDILSNVDENDTDGDGISGKANYVWDLEKQEYMLGRFGWKANQPSLKQQAARALHDDIGITTTILPDQNLTQVQQTAYGDLPNGGSPELDDVTFHKIVSYVKTLAVPVRRDWDHQDVLHGKQLFTRMNCISCHRAKMHTSTNSPINALNDQEIRPYTDLLVHDMGDGLADLRPDGLASGREWRTAPLWGLGMIQTVNGHTFLLHDGRARNMEEAILWHGGEAENSKIKFTELSKKDRDDVIAFLKSL